VEDFGSVGPAGNTVQVRERRHEKMIFLGKYVCQY
jgi:hypothetical protein